MKLRSSRLGTKVKGADEDLKVNKLVSKDCLAEYQSLNYQQSKKIKTLKSELQYIKYRLSEELYKFSSTIEDLKTERTHLIEEYDDKLKSNPL